MNEVYQVCIPHTSRDYFDYEAQDCSPEVGARVWVPFRKQIRLGIVVKKTSKAEDSPNLKTISELIDEQPILSTESLDLCWWISTYYQSPLSEVLPLALPKKYRLGQACLLPKADFYQLNMPLEEPKLEPTIGLN